MIKLLLLEDDPNLGKSLMRFLQKHDIAIDWARNGEEAIDLSYENRYDLYLFDINVPLLNGIELLASLRRADDTTPTIIISAQTDLDSMSQGFDAGADDYVKKPFDPQELLLRIKAKVASKAKTQEIHGYRIDPANGDIYKNGTLYPMGIVQKNLLKELLYAYPNPAPKAILMEHLETHNDGALRVNMVKLKKETGLEIQAVRGVGYKIL